MNEAFITFDNEIITTEDIEKVAKSGRSDISFIKSLERKRLENLFRSKTSELNEHEQEGSGFSEVYDIMREAGIQNRITVVNQSTLLYHYKGIPYALDPCFSFENNHLYLFLYRPFFLMLNKPFIWIRRSCRVDGLKREVIIELLQSLETLYKQWDDENLVIVQIFEKTK